MSSIVHAGICLLVIPLPRSFATCNYPTLDSKQYALTKNKTSYALGETFEIGCKPHYPLSGDAKIECEIEGMWNATGPKCSSIGVAPWWALLVGVVGGIILISCTVPRVYICISGANEETKVHPAEETTEEVTDSGKDPAGPENPQMMAVYHDQSNDPNNPPLYGGVLAGAAVGVAAGAAAGAAVYQYRKPDGEVVEAYIDPTTGAPVPVHQHPGITGAALAGIGLYTRPKVHDRDRDLRRRQQLAFYKAYNREMTDEEKMKSANTFQNLYF